MIVDNAFGIDAKVGVMSRGIMVYSVLVVLLYYDVVIYNRKVG